MIWTILLWIRVICCLACEHSAALRDIANTVVRMAGHLHPPFLAILDEIKAGLRYMFQTESPYTCLISGTGPTHGMS